ncbi:MAG TPA: FliI/YscN family ATPase [candidate division Zixibacteria bacterium]|nr:FliI/YscN family ATPase [candidate division Zixibacteria bacterium]
MSLDFASLVSGIDSARTIRHSGRVTQVVGLTIESEGPAVSVGHLCQIENLDNGVRVEAEVVGFRDSRLLLMPLGELKGVTPGAVVTSTGDQLRVPVGRELIGRAVNGLGRPIDGKGPVATVETRRIDAAPPEALSRPCITEPLYTGVKVIDLTCACGRGQRLGVFAGSGVGKSVTLGMIARNSTADVNVIALIGERGREVREFIERDLGPDGLARSIVVAVTSDEAPLLRLKGAMTATTIAEHFRDQGLHVALMMDSITRVAMAQREIGLAIGEPPATKGYTPSVYALLPRLLERAGATEKGTITGLYTVLVEGDDMNEPVSDLSRSILDGHVSLSRRLAARNQYPAVDVLDSISRLMPSVASPEALELAAEVRELYAVFAEAEDHINIGAYTKGSSKEIDRAINTMSALNAFFRQGIAEAARYEEALAQLRELIAESHASVSSPVPVEAGKHEKV